MFALFGLLLGAICIEFLAVFILVGSKFLLRLICSIAQLAEELFSIVLTLSLSTFVTKLLFSFSLGNAIRKGSLVSSCFLVCYFFFSSFFCSSFFSFAFFSRPSMVQGEVLLGSMESNVFLQCIGDHFHDELLHLSLG